MKLLIASDIHGSAYYCEKLAEKYKEEKADKLILLGDLLYHGPRNDLPRDYAPKKVIEILNTLKSDILAVRGNCEAEVDQMVLDFPVMADYAILFLNGRTVFMTHGHIYNNDAPPKLKKGDILLHGHTHIQAMEEINGYTYINPGSVSIPKNGNKNSYMTFSDNTFIIKDFDSNEIMSYKI